MNENRTNNLGVPPHKLTRLCGLALAVALVGLTGCEATKIGRAPDPVSSTYSRSSVIEVMNDMDVRRNKIKTVKSVLSVIITDNVKAKEHSLRGAYLGDSRGNMRMQIRSNETLILDIAFRNETVEVHLPRKGRFFRGRKEDLLNSQGDELSLLAHIGNAHDLFFPRAWTPKAVERRWNVENGNEIIQVMERPKKFIKKRVRRVVISRLQPVAEQIDVFQTNGKLVGSVIYEDYLFPQPTAGAKLDTPAKVAYPRRITLTTPKGARDMQINAEDIYFNHPIDIRRFEIAVPEDTSLKNLGEWLAAGKSIWD